MFYFLRTHFLRAKLFKYFLLLPILITCSLVLGGCQPVKIKQCNQLNQITNIGKSLTIAQNSKEFSKLADRLDQLQVEVQAIAFEDQNLIAFKNRFLQLYKSMAQSSRQISAAVTDQNLVNQAQQNLKTIANQEISLVAEVNKYCNQN